MKGIAIKIILKQVKQLYLLLVIYEDKAQDVCSLIGQKIALSKGNIKSPGYPIGSPGPLNCSVTVAVG